MDDLSTALNVRPFDLRFDPFASLDAGSDPHLREYLLTPKIATIINRSLPTILYAPPGGGKTAMRIMIESDAGDLSGLTFPLTYLPSVDDSLPSQPASLSHHLAGLYQSAARDTLFYILTYPGIFLDMPASAQRELATLLVSWLPVNVHFLHGLLQNAPTLETAYTISGMLGRFFHPDPQPNPAQLVHLTGQLERSLRKGKTTPTTPPSLTELFDLLKDTFQANDVFLLLDSVDASVESKSDPQKTAQWLLPLFEQAKTWSAQHVYLKAFLTSEMRGHLHEYFLAQHIELPEATLEWNDIDLVETIRKRVAAASDNRFTSLFALSALDLREIEQEIVRTLPHTHKLPREAILIAHQTLRESLNRQVNGRQAQIQRSDLERACAWYHALPNRSVH